MFSLKGKDDVSRALFRVIEKSAEGMSEAVTGIESDIGTAVYGADKYIASDGIIISDEILKKEFGSEDNPPSPVLEAALEENAYESQKRLEEIFLRKMEER